MAHTYRILHVIDSLGIGGTERQLILNLANLDRNRFQNFLCYLYPVDDLADEVKNLGLHTFCLGLKGKRDWLSGVRRLMNFIKTIKVDLVHTNLFEAAVLGGTAARLSGVPAVSTLTHHADSPVRFSRELYVNKFKLSLARLLTRTAYNMCYNHLIAVSEPTRTSWIHSFGINEARVTVIPRAIGQSLLQLEPSSIVNEIKTELSLDGCYPVLLNIGRLIPHKGQKYLLQAIPLILKNFPRAKLLIAGEGPLRDDLERISKDLGLDGVVSFLGSQKEIKRLLQTCDIFVFPSLSEGMPGSLLEAAALGKPCIASNIDPVREILEDGESGLLVAPSSPQALAEAVVRLSSNKEEGENLGRQARNTIMSKFLIENRIKSLEAIYIKIIERK